MPTSRSSRKGASAPSAKPARAGAKPAASAVPAAAAPSPGGPLLDIDQAVAMLKTSRPTFYRWVRQGRIKGQKVGRQWRFYREDLERFLRGQAPRVDLPVNMRPLIETLSQRIRELGGTPAPPPQASQPEQAFHLIVQLAVALRASDVHIEPRAMPDGRRVALVRCRVDGALRPQAEIDIRLLPAVVEQFKRMAACDVHEKHRPQDGRIMLGESAAQRELDLRVCFLPAVLGEAVTVRLLDPTAVLLDLDRVGLDESDKKRLTDALGRPAGLIVLSGPTGCGKTTVLYACINRLTRESLKVMTIEDPVEYLLPGTVQSQINPKAGLTFAVALRAMLRSDPDVLMIAEIRDAEMLNVALQTALTGHLALTALHTEDAATALKRMVEIGAGPFVVADATSLTMSQRLVRRLCPKCSVPQRSDQFMARAERLAREGGLDWDALVKGFREPAGCDQCARTGYRGRMVIAETLAVSPAIGLALRRNASADEMKAIAVSEGMTTLAADGVRKAAAGITTLAEVMRVWRV